MDRNYIASELGTFWSKFRARNPFYKFKEVRVYSGFIVDGEYDADNMQKSTYVIDSLSVSNGMCRIVAKDILTLTQPQQLIL